MCRQLKERTAFEDFARKNVGAIAMTQADILSEVVHGEVQGGGSAVGDYVGSLEATVHGDQGTIGWLVRYGTAGAVDEAEAKTAASADYMAVLAKSAGLFSTGNRMYAR